METVSPSPSLSPPPPLELVEFVNATVTLDDETLLKLETRDS